MDVITIENHAFSQLLANIDSLTKEIQIMNQNNKTNADQPHPKEKLSIGDEWLDNEDACKLFKVTKRTLQNYRDNFLIPYSQIGKKILYKASDLKKVFDAHYVTLNFP